MKVTVEYDTVTKQASIRSDGQEVDKIAGIHFYPSWEGEGKFAMELRQYEINKEDGTSKNTCTYASLAGLLLDEQN